MPLGLKDVVVEFLEFAFACLVDAEECVDEFARLEAIAQDGGVSVVHHRVVLPVAGGAHTAPCGVGVELTRGDVLDLEVLGGVLGQSSVLAPKPRSSSVSDSSVRITRMY